MIEVDAGWIRTNRTTSRAGETQRSARMDRIGGYTVNTVVKYWTSLTRDRVKQWAAWLVSTVQIVQVFSIGTG